MAGPDVYAESLVRKMSRQGDVWGKEGRRMRFLRVSQFTIALVLAEEGVEASLRATPVVWGTDVVGPLTFFVSVKADGRWQEAMGDVGSGEVEKALVSCFWREPLGSEVEPLVEEGEEWRWGAYRGPGDLVGPRSLARVATVGRGRHFHVVRREPGTAVEAKGIATGGTEGVGAVDAKGGEWYSSSESWDIDEMLRLHDW